ncbi:lipoprotein [Mucilaginibacter flavus]|uniref:lipoprotein n=1 Tax=Mucilaginibacter flavus TaxID=931504 RepID=UPI0025B351D2|nr:hypothetical protein [Mucilaginibacter flavus]MDN3581807.1 hypothetical protein [Mucilaginibacter flavus]
MKKIISGALAATVVAACLTINVQAKTLAPFAAKASITAVSDTGKMAKDKMKMDKMKKKKMDKMGNDKMGKDKMGKDKMKKDTGSKM